MSRFEWVVFAEREVDRVTSGSVQGAEAEARRRYPDTFIRVQSVVSTKISREELHEGHTVGSV